VASGWLGGTQFVIIAKFDPLNPLQLEKLL
jgi:hypothetical protein